MHKAKSEYRRGKKMRNMKALFLNVLLPFTFLLSFCQCNSGMKDHTFNQNSKTLSTERGDVQPDLKSKPNLEQILIEEYLGIGHLKNGMEGPECRIWARPSFSDTLKIFLFKKEALSYTSNLYTVSYEMNKKRDSFLYFRFDVRKLFPILSWEEFVENLKQFNLVSLPDYSELPGYNEQLPSDAQGVFIEALQEKKYNAVEYMTVDYFSKKYPEAERVKNLLLFVQKEMKVDFEQF
jgi:hypothetical protein